MEWQPIETAAKEDVAVLLWATIGNMLYPNNVMVVGSYRRGWWGCGRDLSNVTHWMPLPKPPTDKDQ